MASKELIATSYQANALLNLLLAGKPDDQEMKHNPRYTQPSGTGWTKGDTLVQAPDGIERDAVRRVLIGNNQSTVSGASLMPRGLDVSSVSETVIDELCDSKAHKYGKASIFVHLLGPLNTFVSRFVPLYSAGKGVDPDSVSQPLKNNRTRLLAAVGLYLKAALPSSADALNDFRFRLVAIDNVARLLIESTEQPNAVTGAVYQIGADAATFALSSGSTIYSDNDPLRGAAVRAFFADQPRELEWIASIGATEVRTCFITLCYNRAMLLSRDSLIKRLDIAADTTTGHRQLAVQHTIRRCTSLFAGLWQVVPASLLVGVVSTFFAVHVDAQHIMMDPYAKDVHIPSNAGRRVVAAHEHSLEQVGVMNHHLLGNRVLQLLDQGITPFQRLKYDDFSSGQLAALSEPTLSLANALDQDDILLYHFTRSYVRAVSRRMLAGYYGEYEKTLFLLPPAPASSEPALWKINQDQKEPAPMENTLSQRFDRALRHVFFAMWHRFFGAHPDPLYAQAIIKQRQLREAVAPPEAASGQASEQIAADTLQQMLPTSLYSVEAVRRMAEYLNNSLQVTGAGSDKEVIISPLGNEDASAAAASALNVSAADASQLEDPLSASESPSAGGDFTSRLFFAPGQKTGALSNPAFMARVLAPLYESKPSVGRETMAFALRWVLGIGVYKEPTRRMQVENFPWMAQVATFERAVTGVDVALAPLEKDQSSEWTMLVTNDDLKPNESRRFIVTPRLEDNIWKLLVSKAANANHKIVITVDSLEKSRAIGESRIEAEDSGFFVLLVCAMIMHDDDAPAKLFPESGQTVNLGTLKMAQLFQIDDGDVRRTFDTIRACIISAALRAGMVNAHNRSSHVGHLPSN